MKKAELAQGEVATGEATGDGKRKRKRTTYTLDEKMAIVAEAIKVGNTAQVAREKGIAENLLYRWKKDYGDDVQVEPEPTSVEEIKRLIHQKQEEIKQLIRPKQEEINALKIKLAETVLQ